MKKTRDKVSESEKQEVYDIFDEMVKDVMIGVKHDLNKANAIIDQMTSGTITPTAAKQQLLAM